MKRFTILLLMIPGFSAYSQADSLASVTINDKVFNKVDVESEFPGGVQAWSQYLRQNLRSDVPVRNKAGAGKYTVIVRFIVDTDGSLSGITSETNHGYGMEKEVIRVIRRGPKWIPAKINGKSIKAYRRQPVTFIIAEG